MWLVTHGAGMNDSAIGHAVWREASLTHLREALLGLLELFRLGIETAITWNLLIFEHVGKCKNPLKM